MKNLKKYLLLLVWIFAVSTVLGQPNAASYKKRQLILRDEGLSQLSYVNFSDPSKNWYVAVPPGRDLQPVGGGLVLIGTGLGYEEREILTGKKVKEVTTFKGTISARRMRNGNTLLTGLNWEEKKGIVLAEVGEDGSTKRLINYPEFPYVRLVRETQSGTFLITADTILFEGDPGGKILWQINLGSKKSLHSWQAVLFSDGRTLASTGFGAKLQIFSKDGNVVSSITGPQDAHPYFYAGFQILKNGNIVVTNWQGHGPGHGAAGTQLLEYTSDGKLAWSWKPDPEKYSSLQGVIVLDGLNLKYLHVEDADGRLSPVKSKQ